MFNEYSEEVGVYADKSVKNNYKKSKIEYSYGKLKTTRHLPWTKRQKRTK